MLNSMGDIEKRNKIKSKRKHLQKVILQTVATAGILTVGLMAPNVLGSFVKLGIIPNRRQKEYIASSASKLVKRGLLFYDGKQYRLSSDGEKLLRRFELTDFEFDKPKKWDGKWRMIIFDIPEQKKTARNHITMLFRKVGFFRLQNSVWVYPYDCDDVITVLKTDLSVGRNLLYLIVEELENDKSLRKNF